MSRETDLIDASVACLRTHRLPATLISSRGRHCNVWRTSGTLHRGNHRIRLDLVLKVHREACSLAEIRVLGREHERLRQALGIIVPPTRFVATRINGMPSVLALAPAVNRWFDLANPIHMDEAIPLLQRLPRAREELHRFIDTVSRWDREEGRVVDLYGLDNLVLDVNHRVRYIDSFRVFFFADMLHAVPEPDDILHRRIDISRRRLSYLHDLLKASTEGAAKPSPVVSVEGRQ